MVSLISIQLLLFYFNRVFNLEQGIKSRAVFEFVCKKYKFRVEIISTITDVLLVINIFWKRIILTAAVFIFLIIRVIGSNARLDPEINID